MVIVFFRLASVGAEELLEALDSAFSKALFVRVAARFFSKTFMTVDGILS